MWCPQLFLEFNFPDSSLIGMIIEIQSGILEKIQFILSANYLDRAGWSLRHFLNKFKQWHFQSPSNELIWLKKISNYMQRLKSAILAIFQTGPGWPCSVSIALKDP